MTCRSDVFRGFKFTSVGLEEACSFTVDRSLPLIINKLQMLDFVVDENRRMIGGGG